MVKVMNSVKKTVSDEAGEDHWGVRSTDKVLQHTEKVD